MNHVLSGHVGIITGSGRGLGRAMTLAFLRSGCHVVAVDIRGDLLADLELEVREEDMSGRLETLTEDLSDLDACSRLVDLATDLTGPPTILVNNAVLGPDSIRHDFHARAVRWWEVDPTVVSRHFAVNTLAPFALAHAALPSMLGQGYGRIINISTSPGIMQRAGFLPYGGTKAGLEAMTVIMAEELREAAVVTANVLIPGKPANTKPHQGVIPAYWKREDLLPPEAMGPPAVWLASPDASQTTGKRLIAARWNENLLGSEAALQATEDAGWPYERRDRGPGMP